MKIYIYRIPGGYKWLTIANTTSGRVKSYKLVKVVSAGRAHGKSSILAPPKVEHFIVLEPCAWKKSNSCIELIFLFFKLI